MISEFDIELRREKGTHEECQLADYLSRSPILTVGNLFRSQLTIDEWKSATSTDVDLVNICGKWKPSEKFYFKNRELSTINKIELVELPYQIY